jgi:hypothetical protein
MAPCHAHKENRMSSGPAVKTEAGSGGKRGHSNMEHFDGTETVKRIARKARRRADKAASKETA